MAHGTVGYSSTVASEIIGPKRHKELLGYTSISRVLGPRQFETIDDLKEALVYEWEKSDIATIRNFAASKPRRLSNVVMKRGGPTWY